MNPTTKNTSHPRKDDENERAEMNEAEQFSSRSPPELREWSRVSAPILSALKHHREHMVQLMGHGGLAYRTLQLKKSPKKPQHNVNNSVSSHPFFLYPPASHCLYQ